MVYTVTISRHARAYTRPRILITYKLVSYNIYIDTADRRLLPRVIYTIYKHYIVMLYIIYLRT